MRSKDEHEDDKEAAGKVLRQFDDAVGGFYDREVYLVALSEVRSARLRRLLLEACNEEPR